MRSGRGPAWTGARAPASRWPRWSANGQLDELALHLRAARRNGLSEDEIKEVLLQCAVYCGVPAANAAFAVAQRVLAEDDNDEPGGEHEHR